MRSQFYYYHTVSQKSQADGKLEFVAYFTVFGFVFDCVNCGKKTFLFLDYYKAFGRDKHL